MAEQGAAAAVQQHAVVAQPGHRIGEQAFVGSAAQLAAFQPEQREPGAIGRHQSTAAERQQAFARAAQQGAVAMHAQQVAIGQAFVEIAMFDVGHRQPRQPQRMHLRDRRVAGDVQHADQLSIRIEDRRSRAIEDAVGRRVVLAAAHFHRAAVGDRGADRIGAHPRLVPAGARHQRHPAGLVQEAGAAFGIQDPAFGIGEDGDAAGGGPVAGQHLHFRARALPQALVAFAKFAQAQVADRFDARATIRGHAERARTPPRLQDRIGHLPDRRTALFEEGAARLREVGKWGGDCAGHRTTCRRCVAFCDSRIAACPTTQHRPATHRNDFRCCAAAGFRADRRQCWRCAMTHRNMRAWHVACATGNTRNGFPYARSSA